MPRSSRSPRHTRSTTSLPSSLTVGREEWDTFPFIVPHIFTYTAPPAAASTPPGSGQASPHSSRGGTTPRTTAALPRYLEAAVADNPGSGSGRRSRQQELSSADEGTSASPPPSSTRAGASSSGSAQATSQQPPTGSERVRYNDKVKFSTAAENSSAGNGVRSVRFGRPSSSSSASPATKRSVAASAALGELVEVSDPAAMTTAETTSSAAEAAGESWRRAGRHVGSILPVARGTQAPPGWTPLAHPAEELSPRGVASVHAYESPLLSPTSRRRKAWLKVKPRNAMLQWKHALVHSFDRLVFDLSFAARSTLAAFHAFDCFLRLARCQKSTSELD